MINPINIAKSSTQFIFNNSISAVTRIASRVNKIFTATINLFIDAVRSTGNFIYTKTSHAIQSLSTFVFGKPNTMHMKVVYRKGEDGSEEVRIVPDFKKINCLTLSESLLALEKISELDISNLSLDDAKKLWTNWGSEKK